MTSHFAQKNAGSCTITEVKQHKTGMRDLRARIDLTTAANPRVILSQFSNKCGSWPCQSGLIKSIPAAREEMTE